jgi:hypothetical protein
MTACGTSRHSWNCENLGRCWTKSGQRGLKSCDGSDAFDPDVWSGRALQVDFAELAVSGRGNSD